MRLAAMSSAASASLPHCLSASAISASLVRSACAASETLSNLFVSAMSASSPRDLTSAMMPRTTAATSSSVSRLGEISSENCAAKSPARASRRRATSRARFVFGAAERRPLAALIGKPRVQRLDVELDGAAAGEDQLNCSAGILRALRRELDGQQRQHRIRIAAHDLVGLDRQDPIEIKTAADAQIVGLAPAFPFESIEKGREAVCLRQPDEIADAGDRILQFRRNDLQILRVLRGQYFA